MADDDEIAFLHAANLFHPAEWNTITSRLIGMNALEQEPGNRRSRGG